MDRGQRTAQRTSRGTTLPRTDFAETHGCEVFELYLHCPNCRLTVYNPSTVLAPERCLRCEVRFEAQPQRFFRRQRENPVSREGRER